ncbi:MAG: tetratricopeptide repeat protein [bacterium]|nr:tetratricopeptide repeat protein [bacterium]
MSTEDRHAPNAKQPPQAPAEEPETRKINGATTPTQVPAGELAVGSVVAGRYRIVGVVGVGGMGVVYRAHDQTLGIEIALKVLRPEAAQDEEFIERFRNELLLARQVTHRNVVRLHDIGEHEGHYYMSMDLVEGRSLQDLLLEKGRFEVGEAVPIIKQIARALGEAHRQAVVHRDLKPANILLDAATGEAYISDFGIARSLSAPGMTRTGIVMGTPHYLSPEQACGDKVGAQSDVYSLGIIFAQMLSGKLPFPGGTLLEIVTQRMAGKIFSMTELGVEVPPGIAAIIDRCLAKELAERYASADEIIADLEDLERPRRRRRLRSLASAGAVFAGLVAVLLVIAVAIWAVRSFLPPRPAPEVEVVPPAAVEEVAAKPRYSIAILPFRETAGREELAWASTGAAEMLTAALAESENLRVVDSLRVIQMLKDLGFEPGRVRDDQLPQLAEAFQVDRLVVGTLIMAGEQMRIEARLVEVDRPGSPPRQLKVQKGGVDDFFKLVDGLGGALREALEVPATETAGPPLTPSAAAMRAYMEGLKLLSQGETLKAAPALQQAVEEDPGFVSAWVRLARAYEELGRDTEALDAAKQAVRATAEASGRMSYEARAQEALLRGEPEVAQRFLEELVARYPNDAEAQVALAEAYGQQGKFAAAAARLRAAVEVDSSQPRTWYLLGRYAIQAGDSRRAVDDYLVQALIGQKRLRNEQGEAEVLNALGVGYSRLGELDQAADNYRQAAAIRRRLDDRRGLATTLHNLALIDLARADYEAAESSFQEALGIHDELGDRAGIAKVNNALGTMAEERGRYPEALELYRSALAVRKELGDEWALAESYTNIGYANYLLGEYDDAVLYLDRALELVRKNENPRGIILTLQSIGFCQRAQGRFREAVRSFLDALELSRELELRTEIAVSHGNLGLLAQDQGRYSGALSSYGEALAILEEVEEQRGRVEFMLHETEVFLAVGDLEKAGERLVRIDALSGDGGNPEHRASLLGLRGELSLRRGDAAAAVDLFAAALREAEASHNTATVVRAQLGSGLQALAAGEEKRAREELGTAAAAADRLGHIVLRLRVGEALARAELAAGDPEAAAETVRRTLRLAEDGRSWAGTYRLYHLLAAILTEGGEVTAAGDARREATEHLSRIREALDDQLRQSFDQLPEVRELLELSPQR